MAQTVVNSPLYFDTFFNSLKALAACEALYPCGKFSLYLSLSLTHTPFSLSLSLRLIDRLFGTVTQQHGAGGGGGGGLTEPTVKAHGSARGKCPLCTFEESLNQKKSINVLNLFYVNRQNWWLRFCIYVG